MKEWALHTAKNQFSALVNAALSGEPQLVTRRGEPAVVVLSSEEYERLRRSERDNAPTLIDLLLDMPQDGGEFERLYLPYRPFDPFHPETLRGI